MAVIITQKGSNSTYDSSHTAIGTPTDGTYADGLLELKKNTLVPDAFDALNEILLKLVPDKPANLAEAEITMYTYEAYQSSTGILHDRCTDDTTPTGEVAGFFDADQGILSCQIDNTSTGIINITSGDDTGSNEALNITFDGDFYLGDPLREGFWRSLTANITSIIPLSYDKHYYQMYHSETGNTPVYSFWVDDPITTTLNNVTSSLPASCLRYISGVPSLDIGQLLKMTFTVNNAVKTHYNSTKIASITALEILTTFCPPVSVYNYDDSITFTDIESPILENVYTESINVTLVGHSSNGNPGVPYYWNTHARVDTISNESVRLESGDTEFPDSTYGTEFDSTASLKTLYISELQLLNGKYQYPSGNYTSNLPTVGPDYTTGMGTHERWVLFNPIALNKNVSFDLTINDTENFGTDIITDGIKIYAKCQDETGWIDCNKPYSGVGSPFYDGDAAMIYSLSTAIFKKVTFGYIPRSGLLYIRIALPVGSDKKFSGISINNIV